MEFYTHSFFRALLLRDAWHIPPDTGLGRAVQHALQPGGVRCLQDRYIRRYRPRRRAALRAFGGARDGAHRSLLVVALLLISMLTKCAARKWIINDDHLFTLPDTGVMKAHTTHTYIHDAVRARLFSSSVENSGADDYLEFCGYRVVAVFTSYDHWYAGTPDCKRE